MQWVIDPGFDCVWDLKTEDGWACGFVQRPRGSNIVYWQACPGDPNTSRAQAGEASTWREAVAIVENLNGVVR